MKKKILAIFLAITLVIGFAPIDCLPQGLLAIDVGAVTSGDYEYEVLDDGTVEITKYTGSDEVVIVPSTIDGKQVTSIGDYAFYYCRNLTSITIPDGVTSIGDYAFEYCYSLTSITIPDSVSSIGNDAFNGTAWYDNQPDGVVYAGKVTYKYKGEMLRDTKIKIKDGTKGIAGNAFNCKGKLTNITIPDSVTSIGDGAFSWCASLTSITIPDSVTSIGDETFYLCTSLTSITIPDSVTNIGDSAFSWCTSLTSITIPDSVTNIGDSVFLIALT